MAQLDGFQSKQSSFFNKIIPVLGSHSGSPLKSGVNKTGWSGRCVACWLDLCAPWNGTASQNSQWQMPSSPLCYLEPKGNGIQPPAVYCGVVLTSGQREGLEVRWTKSAAFQSLTDASSLHVLNKWGQMHQGNIMGWLFVASKGSLMTKNMSIPQQPVRSTHIFSL